MFLIYHNIMIWLQYLHVIFQPKKHQQKHTHIHDMLQLEVCFFKWIKEKKTTSHPSNLGGNSMWLPGSSHRFPEGCGCAKSGLPKHVRLQRGGVQFPTKKTSPPKWMLEFVAKGNSSQQKSQANIQVFEKEWSRLHTKIFHMWKLTSGFLFDFFCWAKKAYFQGFSNFRRWISGVENTVYDGKRSILRLDSVKCRLRFGGYVRKRVN